MFKMFLNINHVLFHVFCTTTNYFLGIWWHSSRRNLMPRQVMAVILHTSVSWKCALPWLLFSSVHNFRSELVLHVKGPGKDTVHMYARACRWMCVYLHLLSLGKPWIRGSVIHFHKCSVDSLLIMFAIYYKMNVNPVQPQTCRLVLCPCLINKFVTHTALRSFVLECLTHPSITEWQGKLLTIKAKQKRYVHL